MPLTSTAFNAQDRYFFGEGTHSRLYDQLGCHPVSYTHLTLPTIYSV